ncbi:hypothetical protein Ndes2526B_g07228 [Nannochloris sp. 'desiccata']
MPDTSSTTAVVSAATELVSMPASNSVSTTPDIADQLPTSSTTQSSSTTYPVKDLSGTGTAATADNGDGDNGAALPPDGPGDDNDGNHGDDEDDPKPSSSHPLSLLLRGLRGRLAADPFFTQKLLVECGLDAAIIVSVNIAARQERFLPEIEFTFCQLAVSLLSDFALVYLLAPSIYRSAAAPGSLRYKLEFLPSHVFQKSPSAVTPFTKTSRFTTFLMKGVQYSAVGYAMGCLGAASVQGLIWIRERFDPIFVPPPTVQSITGTGFAWSTFMGTSSNVRYNLVHGLEDYLYRKSAKAGTLGSVVLRLLNNYAGAAQWVYVCDKIDLDVPWVPMRPAKDGKGRKARRRNGK